MCGPEISSDDAAGAGRPKCMIPYRLHGEKFQHELREQLVTGGRQFLYQCRAKWAKAAEWFVFETPGDALNAFLMNAETRWVQAILWPLACTSSR